MKPPSNHVTRNLRDRVQARRRGNLPVLDGDQLAALEAAFPPRTKGVTESEGEHQRYAGKVDLVLALRHAAEEHRQATLTLETSAGEEEGGDDLTPSNSEPASQA